MPETLFPGAYEALPGAWVVPELFPAGPMGWVPISSAVLLGREPVLIDTGTARNRERWLNETFSLVDPADVRWIFLSHDDHDHVGNLPEVLDLCPQATLVTNWFSIERLAGDLELPLERCRWINDGESFDVGDRTLVAVRPPVYDSPTTRGLLDPSTGFYWAADAFASTMPEPTNDASFIEPDLWADMFVFNNQLVAPWAAIADPERFAASVERLDRMPISVAVGAHGPAVHVDRLGVAFELLRSLPDRDEAPLPGQADLDAMLAAVGATG